MRIAVVVDQCGPYHVARFAALALHCDLLVVEIYRESREYGWGVSQEVQFRRVTIVDESRNGRLSAMKRLGASKRIHDCLTDFAPDAVAIPGWSAWYAAAAVAWTCRRAIPAIVMSDTQEIDFVRSFGKEAIKRGLVTLFCGAVVAGSRHADYLHKLGLSRSPIRLGYDVVDNEYFQNASEAVRREAPRYRGSLNVPEKYFLVVARFVQKKNLGTVLMAYSRYVALCQASKSTEDPWSLVMVGGGELEEEINRLVSSLGLRDRVIRSDFVSYERMPAYYGCASALILASTTDQWGLVVNEAMACSLPVLVSRNCGCVPELVRHGENGYVFDPYRVDDLVACMTQISRPGLNLSAFGERSRQIINDWPVGRFASALMEVAVVARESTSRRRRPLASLALVGASIFRS